MKSVSLFTKELLPGDVVSDGPCNNYLSITIDKDFSLTADAIVRNTNGLLGTTVLHNVYREATSWM